MRRTPPVVVQLHTQRAVQAAVALTAALAVGGLACWAISHQPRAWPGLLAVPAVSAWAWREAATRPSCLRWDGQAWWLSEPGQQDETAVHLALPIDLDARLLLRASPGPRWLALSRSQQAPHWTAPRATLFAAPGGAVQR